MVKCHKCNYIYDPAVSFVTMPDGFAIAGISDDAKLPECPHCKNIDFMGLHERVY